jgi:predicted N-acyltransferase
VITRSIHWIGHPGLRRAIADYLEAERASVDREQMVLEAHTPFRRGTRM